jgi:hypothetical protein
VLARLFQSRLHGWLWVPYHSTQIESITQSCWFTAWFVAADFSFAILPWFVVWDLNMKQKEKITVAVGLSLGIL